MCTTGIAENAGKLLCAHGVLCGASFYRAKGKAGVAVKDMKILGLGLLLLGFLGGVCSVAQAMDEAQVEQRFVQFQKDWMMLEQLGYRVLAADTPGEAIGLAEEHANEIHLLITDVVMPAMNGRDLAGRLQSLNPGMKILFMSGYTADVIAHRGVLDDGVNFIQKPFSTKDLAFKVREALSEK